MNITFFLTTTIAISIAIAGYFIYQNLPQRAIATLSIILGMIFTAIVIVGLMIVFYIMGSQLSRAEGWAGFVVRILFYIPCLLIDFIQYIKNEYKTTANEVFVLFIIEILLILSYIYIPKLVQKYTNRSGITILENSRFLDKETILATGDIVKIPSKKDTNLQETSAEYRDNFSISLWAFLKPQPESFAAYSKETCVFDYGNGKPKIMYLNKDGLYDKYIVYFSDDNLENTKYEIVLPNQKWNHFVFTYTSGVADLFLNGKLERSYDFAKNNVPPPQYADTDIFKVGAANGLDGAICNIQYYTTPLSSGQVANTYNLLALRNPPTYSH